MGKIQNKDDVQLVWEFYDDERETSQKIVISNPEKYKITNNKQAASFAEKMFRESNRIRDARGSFLIAKNKSIKDLEGSDLTISDRRYLMSLLLYAQFDNKPLKKDGELLNNKTIAELWGVNPIVANRKLRKFVKLNLLIVSKNEDDKRVKNYYLNEKYFYMGKVNKGEKFVKLFQKKLSEVLSKVEQISIEEESKKSQETTTDAKKNKKVEVSHIIGLLNAVIPYFHYQTYYLVDNPDEDILEGDETVTQALLRNRTVLKHLTRTQIGRILGHKRADTRTVDQYMDYLQRAGAVLVTKSNNKRRYIIHPDLMFRMDDIGLDDYTDHIRVLFEQTK